jgi:hypothetical protein
MWWSVGRSVVWVPPCGAEGVAGKLGYRDMYGRAGYQQVCG